MLVSTGDPNRRSKACDCVTEITQARAQTLKSQGYETVDRYLTNYELKQEVATLVDSKMTAIQKMKALRSRDAAANIVLSQDINLTQISQRFNIRKALIQTVFM